MCSEENCHNHGTILVSTLSRCQSPPPPKKTREGGQEESQEESAAVSERASPAISAGWTERVPHHHSDQMKRGSQRNSSEDLTHCAAHGHRWHRQVSDGREDCSSELSRETEPTGSIYLIYTYMQREICYRNWLMSLWRMRKPTVCHVQTGDPGELVV